MYQCHLQYLGVGRGRGYLFNDTCLAGVHLAGARGKERPSPDARVRLVHLDESSLFLDAGEEGGGRGHCGCCLYFGPQPQVVVLRSPYEALLVSYSSSVRTVRSYSRSPPSHPGDEIFFCASLDSTFLDGDLLQIRRHFFCSTNKPSIVSVWEWSSSGITINIFYCMEGIFLRGTPIIGRTEEKIIFRLWT